MWVGEMSCECQNLVKSDRLGFLTNSEGWGPWNPTLSGAMLAKTAFASLRGRPRRLSLRDLFLAVAVEALVDLLGHGIDVERNSEKFLDFF